MKKHSVTKIISGGQTGVDQIGLMVAQDLGIVTGGMAPALYRTEEGSNYLLRDIFKLTQSPAHGYAVRTEWNVVHSDATVLFGNMTSIGSMQTIKFAVHHKKPYIINPSVKELRKFLVDNEVKTLNVAGNRGSKLDSLHATTYKLVLKEALSNH